MAEQLLNIYNSLTLEAQREVFDFAIFLASKNKSQKIQANSKNDVFGSLNKYAQPELIDKEKSAWHDAIKEKYR